jgi:hypothetical protein
MAPPEAPAGHWVQGSSEYEIRFFPPLAVQRQVRDIEWAAYLRLCRVAWGPTGRLDLPSSNSSFTIRLGRLAFSGERASARSWTSAVAKVSIHCLPGGLTASRQAGGP